MEQFYTDLRVANKTEREIGNLFETRYKMKVLEYNNDNRYDIKLELPSGSTTTIEIKEDFTCERTGNVGVEYSCRGKDSGIAISEAKYYLYKTHTPNDGIEYLFMETAKLKKLIADREYFRTVNGGDPGSDSLNYLFKLDKIRSISKKIFI